MQEQIVLENYRLKVPVFYLSTKPPKFLYKRHITSLSSMVRAVVLLAPGFEPIEAITPIDFLRRAGVEVVVAAVGGNLAVKSAHDVTVTCEVKFEQVAGETFDGIICPGGLPGTTNLAKDAKVVEAIKRHFQAGKVVGAICAAPGMLLGDACQIVKGKKACGYPGCDDGIAKNGGQKMEDLVTVDGNLVTSRGPGTAALFGLALIKALVGPEKEQAIGKGTLIYH